MKGSIPEATGDEEEYGSDVKTNPVTHDEDDRDVALGQVSDSGPVLHSQGVYLSTSPPDDEDNMSTTSTTLGSVFSTDSLATSITAFSKESGFSIEQIQTATRVFVSIVQDNELLAPLYEYARNDVEIGPNRLRRHIRGALKTFADNLKEKADDHIQFQASRLVHAKARHAARCIASGEDQNHQPQANSSEDEIAERAVEEAFLDLKAFRIFLTESDAYAIFQADIHAFCTKQSTRIQNLPAIDTPKPLPVPKDSTKRTWYSWKKDTEVLARGLLLGFDRSLGAKAAMFLLLDFFFLLTDDSLVALGWLEPALRVGWTRLRSQCQSQGIMETILAYLSTTPVVP
ncbi:uncharacterized protein J4E79_010374 [Alternaria viburni]|uniref:uncharacterized protein n=1 Tax=Alternaria viburni TaxID=566460 RepID=UPI0020C1BEF5|nr:uncharacterized protein J4E79_010374 [Alternaria viburni]KAI4647223.1 hypothetical protein J4E79_010374 [Alternaria viburni]